MSSSSSSDISLSAPLDLATVLKAFQSLASEIQIDRVLATLLHTMVDNAGADRAALLMDRGDQWFVEAVASVDQPVRLQAIAVADSRDIPQTLIHRVQQSLQPVVIADAATQPDLATDPYVVQNQPKSLLGLPIFQQGRLLAILYLENRLTIGEFTRDRVELLNILCTQAAISLENARLYQQSQDALAKLQESEMRFQHLAANIPGMIYQFRLAADGSVSTPYVSSGCLDLYEVDPEAVMAGKYSLYAMQHPDDHARIEHAIRHSAQTLTPFQQEWRIVSPSGSVKWIQSAARPDQKADGSIVWDGVVIDISDRKQAEADLIESEKYHRTLFDQSSTGLALCTMDGHILYANKAYADILGRDQAELPALTFWEVTPPKYMAAEQSQLHTLQTTGRFGPYEKEYIHKEGHLVPVRLSGVLVERHGEPFIWASVEDISDLKRIEAERQQVEISLRLNEERYRSLITVSSQIVWIASPDGLTVESPNWCTYTGQSLDKLKNFGWLEALHPDDSEHTGKVWNHARETVSPYKVEYRIQGADGIYRYFDVQGVPILNEDGSIREWIGACTDIDDRKRAEQAVMQRSQELAQALQDLQNAQLQMVQNEKMASLGNLVAGVAHEINNPIGFLNGSISNAKDYVQDLFEHLETYQHHLPPTKPVQAHAEDIDLEFLMEDLPKLLESMQSATDRIKSISNSLRTFSRADTEYKIKANLHEGLDSTLLILKYRLKANEYRPAIDVIPHYDPQLPLIDCFPGQLNQVFINILGNAIDMFDEIAHQSTIEQLKANPQIITIRTTLIIDQTLAEIRIHDNGKGISDEVKARIFDHLFTTKGVGKGTGLGLAIARQIVVEKHAGSLEVESTLGQGTEFCIRLPIS